MVESEMDKFVDRVGHVVGSEAAFFVLCAASTAVLGLIAVRISTFIR